MTKVEAIEKVMEDNGGTATLTQIYDNITKYYDLYGWISLMSQLIIINRALYVNKQQEGKICAIT